MAALPKRKKPTRRKPASAKLIEAAQRNLAMGPVMDTATRVAALLKSFGEDYLIIGGYAVNHHGYARHTHDVDFVVRHRDLIRQRLLATGQFKPVSGSSMTIIDRANGAPVDLLPALRADGPGKVGYPDPELDDSSDDRHGLRFVTLPQLVALKLSAGRLRDDSDVVELIKINDLFDDSGFADELPSHLHSRYAQLVTKAQAEDQQRLKD